MTKQEAIEILNKKAFTFCNYERCVDFYTALNCKKCNEAIYMAIEALEQEPKRGKWIDTEAQDYIVVKHRICSVCYQEPSAWSNHKKFNYCPNCGAKMESEEE